MVNGRHVEFTFDQRKVPPPTKSRTDALSDALAAVKAAAEGDDETLERALSMYRQSLSTAENMGVGHDRFLRMIAVVRKAFKNMDGNNDG